MVLVLPVGYGAYLIWQEHEYRQSLLALPVVIPDPVSIPPAPELFKPDAIAAVLGLGVPSEGQQNAGPLQLRASFVSSHGTSRALLTDAQSTRIYAVGERLSDGSVLRRVAVDHVLLWRKGQQVRLSLQPRNQHVMPAPDAVSPMPRAASLHLRPLVEQP